MFAALVLIAFATRDVFAIKVDVILDNFAIWEFLLYAGLIARRLTAPYHLTLALLISGIVLYAVTRILQAFLLIYLFAGSFHKMHDDHLAVWCVMLVCCMVLILLQTWTFPIYWGIIFRTRKQALTCRKTHDNGQL